MAKDVKKTGIVVLHFGPMGLSEMQKFSKVAGEGAVIDPNAARMAGATFAFGDPDLLDDLKARLSSGAFKEVAQKHKGLSKDALSWLATGARGLSSETMFQTLLGVDLKSNGDHPHDSDDLSRCRRLMEQVPELQGRIGEMRPVSETWSALADVWDDLCQKMDEEAPNWRDGKGSGKDTTQMMRSVFEGLRGKGLEF